MSESPLVDYAVGVVCGAAVVVVVWVAWVKRL